MTVVHEYLGELPLFYDHVPLYRARRDVEFYVDEAVRSGGPVLEVGCGTGRITLPIARTGIRVDALDSSAAMLERCASKLAEETPDIRSRVKLHQVDAGDFDLGEKFGLIIAPFRVVQHLLSIDEQLSFLTSAARHLQSGGRLVFDVFNPNFDALVSADGSDREDTPPTKLPDGRVFRRTSRVKRVRRVEQISEIEMTYYLVNEQGVETRLFVHSFELRWYLKIELLHLMERAGFTIDATYGDLNRSPVTDASPDIIVVAQRRG